MKCYYKYDVAISVAAEDKLIAEEIASELSKRKIRYYYYEEQAAKSWGEYIVNLTADTYGRRSRYVLLITSAIYVKKYWSNIERQVSLANPKPGGIHILQLRLDDTKVDGISEYVVHRNWHNNPGEVADILEEKIKVRKQEEVFRNVKQALVVLFILSLILGSYFFIRPKPRLTRGHRPVVQMEKVLVTGDSLLISGRGSGKLCLVMDSFYISNTEVTITQYRNYCDSHKIAFPTQPLYVSDNGPVTNVSWYEAEAFCLSLQGRLPTEDEWVYAAGTGLNVKYSGSNNASKVAVYNRNKPSVVATKSPNRFGIYDMTGNVAEWCSNWFDSTNNLKVVKGGAYNSSIYGLSINYMLKEDPNSRKPYIGFRVAWDKK